MQFILIFFPIAIVLTIFFFVCPSFKNKDKMKELSKYYYAHRGLHKSDVAENSLASFEEAVRNNYGMEFDIRLSSDGRVIVFHDDDAKRAFGIEKPIECFSYNELKKMKLFDTEDTVPLFSDVLSLVAGKTPIIVELKACVDWHTLCKKAANLLDVYNGQFTVQSFDPIIVDWFKINRPQYIRGLLMYPYKAGDYGISALDAFFTRNMFPNALARPQYIAYDCQNRDRIGLKLMTKVFRLPEVSWTVRSQEKLDQCKKDNSIIIFENFVPKDSENSIEKNNYYKTQRREMYVKGEMRQIQETARAPK